MEERGMGEWESDLLSTEYLVFHSQERSSGQLLACIITNITMATHYCLMQVVKVIL